jgi:hypothetical protein
MNKIWFFFKDTHHLGPFSIEEMEAFYRNGEVTDQTLIWKEGQELWEPISKINSFQFLFTKIDPADLPPPLPHIPVLPHIHHDFGGGDEVPPPIPLEVILGSKENSGLRNKSIDKHSRFSKISLGIGALLFIAVVGWYALTQRDAGIQLKIKGVMPVYAEKLEMTALQKSPDFEVALALSLDSLTLWASTNYSGEIQTTIELKSVHKKVLGTEDVTIRVKGELKNHVGKFNRMIITEGSKFFPGEYTFHVKASETHFLNRNFRSLSGISFFKSLNKTYEYDGSALIYAGTPREFEKRLADYSTTIISEMLRPYQEKLERIQTLESILNGTSQNFFMELEKVKKGKDISSFETKFMKELSPLLQTLVVKALEEESNKPVVQIGKQIGEMASDMITKTMKYKKLTVKDKTLLKEEFDKRAKGIKLQIDMNVKMLEGQIQKISR